MATDRHWRAGLDDRTLGEPLRRRDVRRPPRRPGWSTPGFDDRRLDRRATSWRRWPTAWSRRPDRRSAAIETLRPVAIEPSPSGATSSTSGRTSPAGSASRSRPGRRRDHASPRRGARARRARHPAAARGRSDRQLRPRRRRRRDLRAGRSRSTGSATSRSKAGRRRSTCDAIEAVVCHSDMAPTGTFHCSDDAAQPAPRERPLEHARQLRRRADRLPPARRAARLDRRHPGVRAGGGVPLRLPRTARRRGCADLAAEQTRVRHRAGVRPVGRPAVPGAAGGGVGRRRGRRAVGAVRAVRRRRGAPPPVRQHAGVGRPDRRARR